jgi:hypothetical protein
MAKKNFNQGINSLLGSTREISDSQEQENNFAQFQKELRGSVKAGLKEGETRATLILNEDIITKFKALSYWDRVPLKVIMNNALNAYIISYEEKNGKIKPVNKQM